MVWLVVYQHTVICPRVPFFEGVGGVCQPMRTKRRAAMACVSGSLVYDCVVVSTPVWRASDETRRTFEDLSRIVAQGGHVHALDRWWWTVGGGLLVVDSWWWTVGGGPLVVDR